MTHKFVKGTEYNRTYTSVKGVEVKVKDSKTRLQDSIAHPRETIEEKFDNIVRIAKIRIEKGENVKNVLESINKHFWVITENQKLFLPLYKIELPFEITKNHLKG